MRKIKVGKQYLFQVYVPHGPLQLVTVLGKSPHGKDKWYFRKPTGGRDTTTSDFLLEIPDELHKGVMV